MVKPVRKSQRRESRKVEAEPLIWERMSRAPHGRSGLSYDNIVKAAMSIADSEGLQAISMRRIADELGSGTMSLYRYVSSKEQILDLVLNDAYGEIRVPAMVSGDWRNDLRELARQTRTVWARHPWLATLLTQRPPFGPNYLRWFEFSLAATAHLRLPITTRTRIVGTLNAYVAGVVAYGVQVKWRTTDGVSSLPSKRGVWRLRILSRHSLLASIRNCGDLLNQVQVSQMRKASNSDWNTCRRDLPR